MAEEPATLSELARRTGRSKSAVRSALQALERARVLDVDSRRTFHVAVGRGELVRQILRLDDRELLVEGAEAMEGHRGRWAALDGDQRVLASAEDLRDLVEQIRDRQLAPSRIMRAPRLGEQILGGHGA